MLTANDLATVHALYHPTPALDTKYPSPNSGDLMLSDSDLDQLSGILSDYCSLQMQQMESLRAMPCASQASDLCQKWLERAADLRDRIEAR